MDTKIVAVFFFTITVFALAENAEPIHKDSVEKAKPKRGLGGLDDYGFNPFFYQNFAPLSFDTKELSPYLFPENKIPTSFDSVFKILDPEVLKFDFNKSPKFKSEPLTFQQKYESLLLKPEFQSLGLSHTYQPPTIQQTSQPLLLSETYQPSAIPQSYPPLTLTQSYQHFTPQNYQSLDLPQVYQFLNQQNFQPQVKENVKPIVEERQE